MPRLIDADKIGLTDFEIVMCEGSYKNALEMLIDKITNAPTIDAVPVCRCDQCKWWDKEDVQPDGRRRCELLDNIRFEPEFWCAYGERKDNEAD